MVGVGAARRSSGPGGPGDARQREADLLALVAAGDQGAFAELYDLIVGKVHAVVVAVLRDPAQSEEVTQEVMVEIWRNAARHDSSRGSVRTWAATLAHRRAVDRVRSSQAARNRDEVDLRRGTAQAANPDEVSEQVESGEEHRMLGEALESLSPTQLESIRLAYFGGYTYREVADRLGAPEGTVKTRIRDGLARLRSAMEVADV